MPEETADARPSIESEFASVIQDLDLYARQKTDLYLQHYLLEPLDFILRQVIYLSVVASLLVAGTLAITIGVILFVSTLISVWAALLICGLASILLAMGLAYFMFARKLVLQTPKTPESA